MKNLFIRIFLVVFTAGALLPSPIFAQSEFNPHFIISDEEMQSVGSWTTGDIQDFLISKGSYLASFMTADVNGMIKSAANIIYDAAITYRINPKYLLVTLQKEQSLITDDSPTQKQLDWATGYAVCDSCSLSDLSVIKHKGFGKQVDDSAGVIRWYYDNSDQSFVKKKDVLTYIDSQAVIPQSWATAFLYTYTPHLHGNKNFFTIWNTWFSQVYPDGSLLRSASSSEVWLIQNGAKRKFKNQSTLLSRADPNMIIIVEDVLLNNYSSGPEISFPNYSILRAPSGIYLLDYDTIRPFASGNVVSQLGYNPQEVVDVNENDLAGLAIGTVITASTTAPLGVVYQITDLNNAYYLFKDNTLYPITDANLVKANYKDLPVEKHKKIDIAKLNMADNPLVFNDGALLRAAGGNLVYVVEKGKKRKIADDDTFYGMGYKRENIITVNAATLMNIFDGEPLFYNSSLASSKNKFLGDSESPVEDMYKSKLPSYLVAEYPSGRIVSGKNIDAKRPIASLTKLLVVYEALNQNFIASKSTVYKKKLFGVEGNNLALKEGSKLKNDDILKVTLVGSTNNTARMLVAATGLTEKAFVGDVNKRLDEWGADDTKITDVTGLDEGNKSTARNLLKVFTKIMSNSVITSTLANSKYVFKELPSAAGQTKHTVANTNQLWNLTNRNYKILASKTGYTDEAGAVMIMLVQSNKTKKQYTIITLGNSDYNNRFSEPNKIAQWISTGNVKIANN
jgi:D-alanyl-D-alanine carboxypeptidase